MMRKLFIPIFVFSAALCFAGCVEEHNDLEDGGSSGGGTSQGGGSSSGSGSSDKTYNFWTDDCATMGGKMLSSGACYIPCSSDNDCKKYIGSSQCFGGKYYCEPDSCNNKPGWYDVHGGLFTPWCVISCSGPNDTTTCPPELPTCIKDDGTKDRYRCGIKSSSSGGGGGYCKQLGCGGIFCSGKCIGCPGC